MARKTDLLRRGFRYPKLLLECGITKAQWKLVCKVLVATREQRGIAYELENILDIAAELDQKFFRPKGIVMRLDSKHIVFLYSRHTLHMTQLFLGHKMISEPFVPLLSIDLRSKC
jgi:hypothetical protein